MQWLWFTFLFSEVTGWQFLVKYEKCWLRYVNEWLFGEAWEWRRFVTGQWNVDFKKWWYSGRAPYKKGTKFDEDIYTGPKWRVCVYFKSQFCQCDTLKAKIFGNVNKKSPNSPWYRKSPNLNTSRFHLLSQKCFPFPPFVAGGTT